MHETSKSIARRLRDVQYVRYFAGNGIDVGSGDDSIGRWRSLFPLMGDVLSWDKINGHGDAQTLPGVRADSYDWLHSSHCLEHLHDPFAALRRWVEVVRPGGHLVVIVPDEDMYEQGQWPSPYNGDHKHTFTTFKHSSWSPVSINVLQLLSGVNHAAFPVRIERLEGTHLPGVLGDQTLSPVGECAIEFVLRKLF